MSVQGARQSGSGAQSAYAGDITPQEAWRMLQQEETAILIDVRTPAEWAFTGEADLSSLGKKTLLLPWRLYPSMELNPRFLEQLSQFALPAETPLLFLCRSGGRSLDAAIAMTEAGWQRCYNIEGGFEGDHDASGHRGTVNGWKAASLPWRQN